MRARRVGRLALLAAAGLLGAALVLIAGSLALLQTRTGSELVLDRLLPRLDRAIAGDLDVDRVRVSPRRLVLEDVQLRDPEGKLVARVARIELRFSPLALLRGRIELRSVEVASPALWLVADQRGLNLSRALAVSRRGRDAQQGASSSPPVNLQRLTLAGGQVDFTWVRPEGSRRFRFAEVSLEGDGRLDTGDDGGGVQLSTGLSMAGRQTTPFSAPITASLQAALRGRTGQARLQARVGQSRLVADLDAPGGRASSEVLTLRELRLTPALIRALLPAVPVISEISARGELSRHGGELEGDLRLAAAAGGGIEVRGRLNTATMHSRGLGIRGENLNAAALLEGAPATDLSFTADARGGGRSLATLEGRVELQLAPGRIAGLPVGPAHLVLRAADGLFRLPELSAELPGTTLTAHGHATRRRLDVSATVRARDLGRAAESLRPEQPPAIAGRGRLRAHIVGPWKGPSLRAQGRFDRIQVRGHRARKLALRVRVPNVRRPWLASGHLLAGAATLAERQLGPLGLSVRTGDGRSFNARLSLARPQPLAIMAEGRWTADRQALDLQRARISYPGTVWRLLQPARIAFAETWAVAKLQLGAGAQRLSLDMRGTDQRLRATAVIQNLALGSLPALARPAGGELAGRLDARLQAEGPADQLTLTASGSVRDGRFRRLRDLTLEFQARRAAKRLQGEVRAQAPAGQLRARFDVPAAFPPPRRAPLELHLDAPALALGPLLALAGRRETDLGGRARVLIDIGGTTSAPTLDAEASVERLTAGGRPIGDLQLGARARPDSPLDAEVQMQLVGRPGRARLETPVELGRLLRVLLRDPARDELLAMPFQLTAELDAVPLEQLAKLAGQNTHLAGTATMDLAVRGPLRAPTGLARLSLEGLRAPGVPATDARLEIEARDSASGLQGRLAIRRGPQVLASATAHLGLAVSRLADRAALASAPLEVEASVGPVRLQRLVAPAESDRRSPRLLRGLLDGSVRVAGSLGAPRLLVRADLRDATLEGASLGDAELQVRYEDRRSRLDLRLKGEDGGHVRLQAEARADLGYPVVLGRLPLRRLPFSARLEADRYDLTPLGCISDAVRVVEGRLDARADLQGPLAAPRVQGRLEWTDGRVVVAGAGDYRQIHLLAHGDEARLVLDELTARSDGGFARLTATGDRGQDGVLSVAGRAELQRFPIRADGQRLASVSMTPRITGRLSAERAELRARLDEAHVQLAAGERRDIQSLRRPPDIVLFWGDQPLNRAQARKHEALADARRALLADGDASGPGQRTDATGSSAPPPWVRLQLDAPNNVWVRGPDVNIELGVGPDFVVLARPEPAVFGTVFIRRGQVEVLGRRFRLDSNSTVRFNGPPGEPTLDVRAVHRPRHADLVVAVNVSGSPDDLRLHVHSPGHPEYSQADLLMVIATGRPPDEAGDVSPDASARAATLLGGFLADRLQRTLMRRLPIDVLNIDPGDSLRGTQLEAGTYLGDDLYVAYVGRFGGEDPFLRDNQNELQLEYRLSRRWSFEATYGDARRGSADIVWTRRF